MVSASSFVSALELPDSLVELGHDAELLAALRAPDDLASLAGARTTLFEAIPYTRRMPRLVAGASQGFRDHLMAQYEAWDDQYAVLPPSVQVDLENVLAFGSILYADVGGQRRAVYETVRSIDRPYVSFAAEPPRPAPDAIFDTPGVSYFYLGSPGSHNYGHWLVDDLPRAAWLASHRDGVSVLLPSHGAAMDAVRRDSLRMLIGEPMPPITFLPAGRSQALARVSYVSPVTHHPVLKLPAAMRYVRDTIRAAATERFGDSGAGRRLFVIRGAARGRGIINLAEIEPLLADAGYETVDPETYDFAGQVDMFRAADRVIGVMGAAMTNTLFCPPGARVGYLAPVGWFEPFYWDLAGAIDQDYFVQFGPVAESGQPPHLSPFTLDPAATKTLLAEMDA